MKLSARLIITLSILGWLPMPSSADIVKPALIEITVNADGTHRTEIRASIEALLTGIDGRYRNTSEAPTAVEYDALRVLEAEDLRPEFGAFQQKFLDSIQLSFDGHRAEQRITSVTIPEPGYTKVPRISLLILEGRVPRGARSVSWYYPLHFGDNAVRVRQVDEVNEKWHWSQWQWIREDHVSEPFALDEGFVRKPVTDVVLSYIRIGFDHIIPLGVDHILFIVGIFLISRNMKTLLLQVTMFTVAHTITLGLAMNGVIEVPARIVEPLIALSIAYIGMENILRRNVHKSHLVIVFLFGLLHGMGFAGALSDFGMPESDFLTALISFNVGVELGQLAVISVAFVSVGLWFRMKDWYHKAVVTPISGAISFVGFYWAVERVALF